MSEVEAAFAAGYAAAQREQDAMPGTGEKPLDPGTPAEEPQVRDDPTGGVT